MPLLLSLKERDVTQDISAAFREAAEDVTRPAGDGPNSRAGAETGEPAGDRGSGGAGAAGELGLGVFTAFDSLLSIFEGTRPAPAPRKVESGSFESAAQEAAKRDREREDAEEREKHRAFYGGD
jgi:hypothetical protein